MQLIDIIFWLMYTMKITTIIIKQKLLLFVGCTCHEEGKIGIIYFETTHKRIYIHIFPKSVAQAKHEKLQ